jgi:hypothetical protein
MTIIPEDVVESAWREVGSLPESAAQQRIANITETQPALLAFVMAGSEDLSREAQELGVYIFVVVLHIFEKHCGAKLKTVEIEALERLRDRIEGSLLAMASADDASFEQTALAESKGQPFVMKYIAEALFEEDPDDGVQLSEEEIGELSIIMKTVVDALQEAAEDEFETN